MSDPCLFSFCFLYDPCCSSLLLMFGLTRAFVYFLFSSDPCLKVRSARYGHTQIPEMSRWVVNGIERICIFDQMRPSSLAAPGGSASSTRSQCTVSSSPSPYPREVVAQGKVLLKPPPLAESVRVERHEPLEQPPLAELVRHEPLLPPPRWKGKGEGKRVDDSGGGDVKGDEAFDDDAWGGWTTGGSRGTCSWTQACRGDAIWMTVPGLAHTHRNIGLRCVRAVSSTRSAEYYRKRQHVCKRMPQGWAWPEEKVDWSMNESAIWHKGDGDWGKTGGHQDSQWQGKRGSSSGSRTAPYMKEGKKGGCEQVKRGGWFARCQLICSTVLAHNWGTARELADEFYAGPHKFD